MIFDNFCLVHFLIFCQHLNVLKTNSHMFKAYILLLFQICMKLQEVEKGVSSFENVAHFHIKPKIRCTHFLKKFGNTKGNLCRILYRLFKWIFVNNSSLAISPTLMQKGMEILLTFMKEGPFLRNRVLTQSSFECNIFTRT